MATAPGLSVIGCRTWSWKRGPTLDIRRQISMVRRCRMAMASVSTGSSGLEASRAPSRSSTGEGSTACSITAAITASLSSKTRKMVPSAIPAASAICRVVTISACSSSSGRVAAMMAERRSSGGRALARPLRLASTVGPMAGDPI